MVRRFRTRVLSVIALMFRRRLNGLNFSFSTRPSVLGIWVLSFIWATKLLFVRRMVVLVVLLLRSLWLALRWLSILRIICRLLYRLNCLVARKVLLRRLLLRFMFLRLVLFRRRLLTRRAPWLALRMLMIPLLTLSRCRTALDCIDGIGGIAPMALLCPLVDLSLTGIHKKTFGL